MAYLQRAETDTEQFPVVEDHPAELAGAPLTARWRVRHQTLFLYEVDLDAIEPRVPRRLAPAELRPGVGLLSVETLQYLPGHFGDDSDVFEIVYGIAVEPNHALAMPPPKISLFILSVASSSAQFVANESVLLRMPMEHRPALRMAYREPDRASVVVTDGDTPIATCANALATQTYVAQTHHGLIYTEKAGTLHQGVFRWRGAVSEHQRRGDRTAPGIHASSLLCGIAPSAIRGSYLQMAADPAVSPQIAYYHLGPLH